MGINIILNGYLYHYDNVTDLDEVLSDTADKLFNLNKEDPFKSTNMIIDDVELDQAAHENNTVSEIERKWLISAIPDNLEILQQAYSEQLYLSVSQEIRIRKKEVKNGSTTYYLDVKGEGDLTRQEISIPISEIKYKYLKEMVTGNPIIKDWYLFRVGQYELEVTIVDPGTTHSFMYAEVEFETEEEANKFIIPIEDAVEVTYDNNYKMKNYWKRTRI